MDTEEWGNVALLFTRTVKKTYAPSEFVNKLEISTIERTNVLFGKTRTRSVAYFTLPEMNEKSASDPGSEDEATARNFSPATSSYTASKDNNFESGAEEPAPDPDSEDEATARNFSLETSSHIASGDNTVDFGAGLRGSNTKESQLLRAEYDDIHGTASGAARHSSQSHAHRWMPDNRVSRMSDEERTIFAERKFKKEPRFYPDSNPLEIPPPHLLF